MKNYNFLTACFFYFCVFVVAVVVVVIVVVFYYFLVHFGTFQRFWQNQNGGSKMAAV